MTTDQWIDRLETRLAAPDHKERGRAPEPRFHTYLENLGWIQLFNYSINRFHTDPAFNLETQIRQKIFHLDHFNDDSTFGMDVSASLGMYFCTVFLSYLPITIAAVLGLGGIGGLAYFLLN